MSKPTLVIMAAGIGSRYGGFKQIDSVGPSGEIIMDYSVYDAIRAGFGKIVFIIGKEIEEQFNDWISRHISHRIPVEYVIQDLYSLPEGYTVPDGRSKPWGTGHAVYCCRNVIDEPFAVINADDFYGIDAFIKVAGFLSSENVKSASQLSASVSETHNEKLHCCMAGYHIENTLTENGYVSRGVCTTTQDGYLSNIVERTRIERRNGRIAYASGDTEWTVLEPGCVVSMNMWGFAQPVLKEFEGYFVQFLQQDALASEKAEFYLPYVVNELLNEDKADVKVLKTDAQWYGVTYRKDKDTVVEAILKMVEAGKYPERLWNDGK